MQLDNGSKFNMDDFIKRNEEEYEKIIKAVLDSEEGKALIERTIQTYDILSNQNSTKEEKDMAHKIILEDLARPLYVEKDKIKND